MKNKSTYILIIIVGSIIIGTILYFGLKETKMLPTLLPQQSQLIVDDSEPKPPAPFGQVTRDYVIKHIEWTYRNGKSYEQFSLMKDGPKDYLMTLYPPNNLDDNLTTWQEKRGGIMVFHVINNKPELMWESTEDIQQYQPELAVRDVTGDGINEIVSLWQNDVKSEQLFIYKLNKDNGFDLLTPSDGSKMFFPLSASKYSGIQITDLYKGGIQITDLDKDGIPEVTILKSYPEKLYKAYKWNGTKYFLWKTSPKPFTPYSPSIADDSEPKPPEPWGQITRDYVIKHVEWTYAHGKSYEQFSLKEGEPKDLVIELYPPNNLDDSLTTWQETRGGILVFRIIDKKPKLIWESVEDIQQYQPILGIRDMTGDGIGEIVVMWGNDVKSEQLFIYKLNKDNGFDLLTPSDGSKIFFPLFASKYGGIQIVDLDKDRIPEVTIFISYPEKFYEAYKWNGKEYYLWKTSPTPFAPYSPF